MPLDLRESRVRRSARLNPSTSSLSRVPVKISAKCRTPRNAVFVELALRPDITRNKLSSKRRRKSRRTSKIICSSSGHPPGEDLEQTIQQRMTFAILERDTRSALLFLEEHFTCPLCCETIAHPVSVTSSCGHVFCTICILRWLFSLVHEVCGGWHTNVGCPICRETLSLPPYDPPRSLFTLPIVFNRTAARILDEVIEKLEVNAMAVLDTKDSCVTQLRNDSCSIVSTSTSHFTKELVKWSKSGSSHKDWTQRCLEGKTELDDLIENWKDMAWTDFQAMKRKLEV